MKRIHVRRIGCTAVMAIVVGIGAATAEDPKDKDENTSEEDKAGAKVEFPVIGYLETRHYTVVIKAGPEGRPVYSVRSREGRMLTRDMPEAALQARLPKLYETLKGAIAGSAPDGKNGAFLDARLTPLPSTDSPVVRGVVRGGGGNNDLCATRRTCEGSARPRSAGFKFFSALLTVKLERIVRSGGRARGFGRGGLALRYGDGTVAGRTHGFCSRHFGPGGQFLATDGAVELEGHRGGLLFAPAG